MKKARIYASRCALALLAIAATLPASAQTNSDETQIRLLIDTYTKTIDAAVITDN